MSLLPVSNKFDRRVDLKYYCISKVSWKLSAYCRETSAEWLHWAESQKGKAQTLFCLSADRYMVTTSASAVSCL